MILVTGGCWQGKLDWAAGQFRLSEEEILDGADCGLSVLCEDADSPAAPVIRGLNHF